METPGVISHWNDDKGFGFIRPKAGGEEVFLHISAFRGERRPQIGDPVRFVAGKDPRGRLRAEHAQLQLAALALDEPREQARPAGDTRPLWKQKLKLAFFLSLGVLPVSGNILLLVWGLPWPLLVYFVVSLLTYYFYWDDKRRAERGAWRTSEAALHLCELLGGWPGALIAQQRFRHKTRKLSFQVVFWLIVLMHQSLWCMVVGAWLLGRQ